MAAAATHGVIRVGHAVRALLEDGEDGLHLDELAHGLAYWAARFQPVPGPAAGETRGAGEPGSRGTGETRGTGDGRRPPAELLEAVPRIADQSGGVRERLD
ncbi:MAG: questin oxidase family protein, partial [Acidimicrobiales bacterium]